LIILELIADFSVFANIRTVLALLRFMVHLLQMLQVLTTTANCT